MKKFAVCFLMMFCLLGVSNAFAGDHLANVIWTTNNLVVGYDSTNNGAYVYASSFDLDVGTTDYYYTVNGVINNTQGGKQACTGTCYYNQAGQVSLDLQCGTSQIVLVLDEALNGQAHVIDYNDNYIDSGPIYIHSVL